MIAWLVRELVFYQYWKKRLMRISTEMDCWDILQQLQLKILQSVI